MSAWGAGPQSAGQTSARRLSCLRKAQVRCQKFLQSELGKTPSPYLD